MTWHVAPGTLKGTVYYNSYGTALVTNSGTTELRAGDTRRRAATLRRRDIAHTVRTSARATLAIKPGTTDPRRRRRHHQRRARRLDDGGCRVCHAVSANGSTLFTQQGAATSYQTSIELRAHRRQPRVAGDAGDEHRVPGAVARRHAGSCRASGTIAGDTTTQAYSIAGALLATQPALGNTGWTAFGGGFPTFSPDGKHLAFNYQVVDGRRPRRPTASRSACSATIRSTRCSTTTSSCTRRRPASTAGRRSCRPTTPSSSRTRLRHRPAFGFTRYNNTGQLVLGRPRDADRARARQLNGKGYLPTSAQPRRRHDSSTTSRR